MLKEVHIGTDPRNYLEFSEIRDEINKLNDPNFGQINSHKISQLATLLFNKNGVDLQTLIYFTFAQTKLHNLDGFYKSCLLLARFISDWDKLWPYSQSAKINLLNWLNSKVGDKVRAFAFTPSDISFLTQIEEPLKKIVDKLKQQQLDKTCTLVNLYEYIKNTRLSFTQREIELKERQQAADTVLIYSANPLNFDQASNKNNNEQLYIENQQKQPENRLYRFTNPYILLAFFCGVVITCCSFIGLNYCYNAQSEILEIDVPLLQTLTPNTILQITEQNNHYNLPKYEQQLQQISNLSPLALRNYAANLAYIIKSKQTDNLQSLAVKQYEQLVKTQANGHFMQNGYFVAELKLQQLMQDLLRAEQQNSSITISKLKTDIYQIQTSLKQEIPIEELLRQLSVQNLEQSDHANNLDNADKTLILIKDIDTRFNNLISYYHKLISANIKKSIN